MASISDIYRLFGVQEDARLLEETQETQALQELEETISNFILVKSLEDLAPEQQQEVEAHEFSSVEDLFSFFSTRIENYPERLAVYGKHFRDITTE